MAGDRLGPYLIDTELGAGGMGTVYRATVAETTAGLEPGARVAIKVIHPHLVGQPEFIRRFLREAQIGQLVRHENVVSTLDAGEAEMDGRTLLYLVMEFVEGRTLRQVLGALGTVPEGLLRELALQIAAGLTAIHAAGIVHRDLKPENLLVTDAERVCVMDLGVARLLEGSVNLTATGHFAGSVLYAAPEQFRRELVGPPADLYALGVVLYEMASGRNPFRRDDVASSVHAQLEEVPPPLDAREPGVSLFLSEVVATLLAKSVDSRFPTATALRETLEAGERSEWWMARERGLLTSRAVLPEVPVRRDTSLHGRTQEVDLLAERWEAACEGEGGVVLVEGEAGIGKTRLVDALLRSLGDRDAHVFYGGYLPAGGLGALSEAIVGHFGTAELTDSVAPYLGATPGLVEGFSALVRHEAVPEGAWSVQGDAVHTLMVNLLRALAAEKPVLWVVEDLQFAPPESRALLVSVARAVAGHAALLVVTTRPGRTDDDLARLAALPHFRRLALDRLSPREVMEVLREAFQSAALADRLGGRIAYKSDGVPFFVFEMVRGLEEGGFLARQDDGTYVETRLVEAIEVPSAVRDLVEARLGDLDRQDRAILDVAAVQGFEFDADLVARVLERKRIPVLQALAEVERYSSLVRAAGHLLRFDHHHVRDVLYESLPETLRIEYHAALAAALAERDGVSEVLPPEVPEETCVFLVRHHLRGSRPVEALPYLDRALQHLGQSYRNEAVVEHIELALGVPGLVEGERRVELLLRQAQGLGLLGRREAQELALDAARVLTLEFDSPKTLARVLTDLGWYQVRVARYGGAETNLREAVALARQVDAEPLQRIAIQNLGVALLYLGRLDEGESQIQEALALARGLGDRLAEASALGNLGTVLRARGHYEEALANHQKLFEVATEIGEPEYQVTALGNIGNVQTYQREYEAARQSYTRALGIARQVGDRYQEATLLGNLAGSLQSQERFGEALEVYDRAVAMSREIGNLQGEANVLLNLGQLLAQLGDIRAAGEILETAVAIARKIGEPRVLAYALQRLADLCEARGDLEDGRKLCEEILDVAEKRGGLAVVVDTRTLLADILLAQGRVEEARRQLESAVELSKADASTVPLLRLRLACLPGGDTKNVPRFFELATRQSLVVPSIEAAYLAWKATGANEYLERAWSSLEAFRAEVPERFQDLLLENVPRYREIHTARQGGALET